LEVGWLKSNGDGVDVLDAGGNPQRRTVRLGPITVSEPIQDSQPAPATQLADLGSLRLLRAGFDVGAAEAGSRVLLDVLWQIEVPPVGKLPVQAVTLLEWTASQGTSYPLTSPVSLPFDQTWEAGSVVRSRTKLATPYEALPGLTALSAEIRFTDGTTIRQPLAELRLEPTDRNFAPPTSLNIETDTNFAGLATLLGASLDEQPLTPGESTPLTLYWQANGDFGEDYTIFVHVLGPDGTPILNLDHAPPRPTSNWLEGEIIADAVSLTIPADLPPGSYPLEVGLYNTADPNYARLPVQAGAAAGRDYVILAELEIVTP
jgi:hypothetical protein